MKTEQNNAYSKRIAIRMSNEDKLKIEQMAKLHGMTTSQFMRKIGLGFIPVPLVDMQSVKHLMKVSNDLARLGNLLKYWLADDIKLQIATRKKIEEKLPEILDAIHEERLNIHNLIKEVNRGIKYERKRWV